MEAALAACADIGEAEIGDGLSAAETADALRLARAVAIADALRSQRWSVE